MAIEAAAIERPDIERLPRGGRVTRQHVNVALLTHEMNALRQ